MEDQAPTAALAPEQHDEPPADPSAAAVSTDARPSTAVVAAGLNGPTSTQSAGRDAGSPSHIPHHGEGKKTGRPVHPLWAHFHRGEKRNRYHYHAFCVYCVARLGLQQVAPTRGVSTDMLRHLEGCVNCPREIVEQVKEMCERRERVAAHNSEHQRASASIRRRKKAANSQQFVGAAVAATVQGVDANAAMTSLLGGVDVASTSGAKGERGQESSVVIFSPVKPVGGASTTSMAGGVPATPMEQVLQRSINSVVASSPGNQELRSGSAASVDTSTTATMSSSLLESSQMQREHTRKQTSAEMLSSGHAMVGTFVTTTVKNHGRQRSRNEDVYVDGSQHGKQRREKEDHNGAQTDSEDDGEWVASVLKSIVASNLPLSVLQHPEFLTLLQHTHPSGTRHGSVEDLFVLFDDAHIVEAVKKLAKVQLDRVKEGMLNSTIIKGGLTLSINCWSTLDLQHLVAFSLLNSNGDAACVRVVDMGNHVNAYTSPKLALAIEDVLDQLGREQQISVMGIVADSVVALNAARRVCRVSKWASLLVVPCVSAVLSTLAGSIFTHAGFHEAVGTLIEIASLFSNPSLLSVLREVSGMCDAYIPLPRRDSWHSIVDCLGAVLEYADVITAICVGSTRATTEDGTSRFVGRESMSPPAPESLIKIVVANNGVIWNTLRDMERVLAPLREAYSVVTVQEQQQQGNQKLKSAQDNAEAPGGGGETMDEPFNATVSCGAASDGAVQSGLTLAHVMHQFGRMSQQYAAMVRSNAASGALTSSTASPPLSPTALSVAELMQTLVDTMWRRYDLPAMVLAYVFDFHLDASTLNFSHPLLSSKAVALYSQRYFCRWFTSDASLSPPPVPANIASGSVSLSLTGERAAEILNAYQLRQFPFDPATTSDYTDVSSFYSFVSDSHPEICALCCRLYALGLGSANVRSIIHGVGVVPPIAQTTDAPATVELLLHIGFAASLKKCLPPPSERQRRDATSLVHGESSTYAGQELLLCGAGEWASFALEWRRYLDHELAMDEFEQLSQITTGVSDGNGSSGSITGGVRDDSMTESLRHLKLSLGQTFTGKLPPLVNATFIADVGEGEANVQHPSSVLL